MATIGVYKASAGSGKTYTLVYEYIKYLFESEVRYMRGGDEADWVVSSHRGILAVTFTNKATEDMKGKILSSLDKMSRGDEVMYVEWLRRDMGADLVGVDDKVIAAVAGRLCADLLTDYTMMRVQTIDGFFQQVVRSFATEFNLNTDYAVELEVDSVIERGVDAMLGGLGDDGSEGVLEWVTMMVADGVDDDKSWNPRGEIIRLSKYLAQESLKKRRGKGWSVDRASMTGVVGKLRGEVMMYEDKLRALSEEVKAVFGKYGLDYGVEEDRKLLRNNSLNTLDFDSLKRGGFEHTATVVSTAKSGEYFIQEKLRKAKKNPGEYKLTVDEMVSMSADMQKVAAEMVELCEDDSEEKRRYNTCVLILKNIYVVGILNEVERRVEEICKQMDMMMITSTTEMIEKVIDGSTTPFIYDRIGVWTDHFMIDEFQDTSMMQWDNFKALLREALSRGESSMIVGDIKQSIYRWRNGDWHLLYDGVKREFGDGVEEHDLTTNFRSARRVVEFNNVLYKALPERLDELFMMRFSRRVGVKFASVYGEAVQGVKKGAEEGYVECSFIDAHMDNIDRAKQVFNEMSCAGVVENIQSIAARGGDKPYSGMAVLARENWQLSMVAEYLAKGGIPFCSAESLSLADNLAVRLVISTMRMVVTPYEKLYRIEWVSDMVGLFRGRALCGDDNVALLNNDGTFEEWLEVVYTAVIVPLLVNEGNAMQMWRSDAAQARRMLISLCRRQLEEVVADIVSVFDLDTIDDGVHVPFINALKDAVQEYSDQNGADILAFIDYWDMKGGKMYLPLGDTGNVVRLVTIHKSKGLEFDTVFLPFINYSLGFGDRIKMNYMFWEIPDELKDMGIDALPFVAIDIMKAKMILNSYFGKELAGEFFDYVLDELNVFYVATTRAKTNLYINMMMRPESKGKSTMPAEIQPVDFVKLIKADMAEPDGLEERQVEYKTEDVEAGADDGDTDDAEGRQITISTYRYGGGHCYGKAADERSMSVFALDRLGASGDDVLKVRRLPEYVPTDDYKAMHDRLRGIALHRLFAAIRSVDDVEREVDRAIANGDFGDMVEADEVRSILARMFANNEILALYDTDMYVVNEAEIWDNATREIYRPDRLMLDMKTNKAIVVDYKFGECTDVADARYRAQVGNYMRIIRDMGYEVKGYLVYAMKGEMKEVNNE